MWHIVFNVVEIESWCVWREQLVKMSDDGESDGIDATNYRYVIKSDLKELMETQCLKEIGSQAIWSVSSCKQGKTVVKIMWCIEVAYNNAIQRFKYEERSVQVFFL